MQARGPTRTPASPSPTCCLPYQRTRYVSPTTWLCDVFSRCHNGGNFSRKLLFCVAICISCAAALLSASVVETEASRGAVAGYLHDCQHTGPAECFCDSSVLWQGYALCQLPAAIKPSHPPCAGLLHVPSCPDLPMLWPPGIVICLNAIRMCVRL